jgi:predicted transcriptional regulator
MSRSTYVFDESIDQKLQELAKSKHTNKTEILKRAIALYGYIESNRTQGTNSVTVVFDPDKKVELVMP